MWKIAPHIGDNGKRELFLKNLFGSGSMLQKRLKLAKEIDLILRILECFQKHGSGLSADDLSRHTKISCAIIRDALEILKARRYVVEDDVTGRYKPGQKIVLLQRL